MPRHQPPTDSKTAHTKKGAVLTEAGNGIRTRDTLLGKQMLYQLSYTRVICSVV